MSAEDDESIISLSFTPDYQWLISGSSKGDLRVWNALFLTERPVAMEFEAHELGVSCIQMGPVSSREKG